MTSYSVRMDFGKYGLVSVSFIDTEDGPRVTFIGGSPIADGQLPNVGVIRVPESSPMGDMLPGRVLYDGPPSQVL